MGLFHLIFILAVIGVALYFVMRAKWIDAGIKKIIYGVVIVVVVIWLLTIFFPGLAAHDIPIKSIN